MTQGITDLERERAERMRQNEARLQDIGLARHTIERELAQHKAKAAAPRPRASKRTALPPELLRRSGRVAHIPAPNYRDREAFQLLERPARREEGKRGRQVPDGLAPKRRRSEGLRLCSSGEGWNAAAHGLPSTAAADAARDAEDEITKAGGAACAKVMTGSQVSGGFWCQLPYGLSDAIGTEKVGAGFWLHCDDDRYADEFVYAEACNSKWHVVYLPRPNNSGAGLSGGWRGFAIDQDAAFKVVKVERAERAKGGTWRFLVRWEGFSPAWVGLVVRANVDVPPRDLPWAEGVDIPREVMDME